MIADVLNIGATGLNAAQVAISTAQNNIANTATPGYHAQQVNYTSIPLSVGGGVSVTVTSQTDPQAEQAYNNALGADSQAAVTTAAATQVQNLTNNSQVSTDWQNFFQAYTNYQQGSSPSNLNALNTAGQALSTDYANWQSGVNAITGQTKTQMASDQLQYEQLQVEALNTTDPTLKSQLLQQVSQLQGKLQGEGQIVSQLPQLIATVNIAMQTAMQKVNSQAGTTVFDKNSQYQATNMTPAVLTNSSISATDVSSAIAAMIGQATTNAQIAQQTLSTADAAVAQNQAAINKAYGVNLTNEAVKVTQAQQLAQAMTNIMSTWNAMFSYFIQNI